MNERFEKSSDDLERCLPFQIRPNFGAICLSIFIRLPHEMMVSSTGAVPVPNGFGRGRIEGMEWVDGAYTRCKRELAWMTAPSMLIAPDRTHISYWPSMARFYADLRPCNVTWETGQMLTSFGWSLTVHSVSAWLRTLLFDGLNVESLWTGAMGCAPASDSISELPSLLVPLSVSFSPCSRESPCMLVKPSVCCSGCGLLRLGLFPIFCLLLGGIESSSGSLCVSVTTDVCTSFPLVISPMGRRAALRAANALTALFAIRTMSSLRLQAEAYLPLNSHEPCAERQSVCFSTIHVKEL